MSFPNNRHGNTPPYLLSAYGIAVKHGYTGTEEEWLASLKGDEGEYPRMQFDSETGYLQIRYDDSGEWTDIASLADLMTESEEAVVASAKEYADTAEAYAKGTVDGEAVEEGDPGYEDNAKYYAGQASTYASAAGGFATGASNYAQAASGYATTASGHADNAAASATAAAGSASDAAGSATSASNSAGSASTSASSAQAQATQAGTYAYNADQSAQAAASYAAAANTAYSAVVDVANGVDVKVEDIETQVSIAAGYATNAGTSATNAATSATAASGSATAAAGSATTASGYASAAAASAVTAGENAEAWAVGTRGGQPVPETDDAYENNSKYYAEQAADVAESIPEDYSELSGDVADLKSAINAVDNIIYDDVDITPPSDELSDNGYVTGANNANLGRTFYNADFKHTDYIDVSGSPTITLDVVLLTANTQYGLAFYDAQKTAISGYLYPTADSTTHETKTVDVPSTAKYVRISIYKQYLSSFFLDKKGNIADDVDDIKNDVNGLATQLDNTVSIGSYNNRLKPYIVETKARYLWAMNQEPDIFKNSDPRYTEDGNANNAYFKISGNQGDNYVTVITGGNASPSDISGYAKKWSAVISYDGVNYEPCLAWYRDSSTLGVYPSLKDDISEGELGAIWSDGLHLTRRGYIGFAQAIFNADPKYCEKKSYIAKWIAGDTVPFTTIGDTMYASTDSNFNYNTNGGFLFANQFMTYFKRNSASSATTGKRGISWTVATSGKKGYVEIMIGGGGTVDPAIPSGNEIHIDVYGDNVLLESYIKTINILEDVCIDFEGVDNVKIEIYLTQQAISSGNGSGFRLSSIHFWEHERDNADSLFPRGAVVGQMFDSWGVFHDGASAKEFSRLINAKTGVTVPYTNHSLGSQTSAWGKAWFYENLQQYHPTIGIVDFGINDANSYSETVPATVLGPDGTAYDNKIDIDEYAVNMQTIADEAKANGIQIIMTGFPLNDRGNWYYALTDNVG